MVLITNPVHVKKLEQGKQGVTGLASQDNVPYVYKCSQYMNYLTFHEYTIMKSLETLSSSCPHFCRAVSLQTMDIHPNFIHEENPFHITGKAVSLDVLWMEYIPDSISFLDLINDETIPLNVIMAVVKQILIALIYAQQEIQFTHYDLHSMNILIKKCETDRVHFYDFGTGHVYYTPTYGYIPIIIDFGFASSNALNGNMMSCSLSYTDAGYLSPAYDPIADVKLFLVSVRQDIIDAKREDADLFVIMIRNIFYELNIDWTCGWDDRADKECPILDRLLDYMEDENETSPLFKNYSQICIDILQGLITNPLTPLIEPSLRTMRKAYSLFVREFEKIELEVNQDFLSLVIFRYLVLRARELRSAYTDEQTRKDTIQLFKCDVFTFVNKSASFCHLKTINWEMMLCSLYMLADHMESQLYYLLSKKMKQKFEEYSNLRVQSTAGIFNILDFFITDDYIWSNDTHIKIYSKDKVKIDVYLQEQPDVIALMNSTYSMIKGAVGYEYLFK